MPVRFLIAALALPCFAAGSEAGPRRRAQPTYYQPSFQPSYQPSYQSYAPAVTPTGDYVTNYTPVAAPSTTAGSEVTSVEPGDGLHEVNAKRAARGLPPFVRDEALTQAARSCAAFRAEHGLFGHTSNDFAFVPAGTTAASAGCAAYPAEYGWMSCCTYEGYTYAGAAWVTGRDGKRYMHLYVR